MPYCVYLKKNEEKRILAGHPWVYANEVARIEGKDANGSVAEVFSHDGRYIGKGLINHLSKILVRILTRGREEIDRDFFLSRIRAAAEYRKNLGYSDCYRAVFAEADGLPAFIVDRYHDLLSVQFLSLGMDRRKELLCDCLEEVFAPRGIYERSDSAVRLKEGLPLAKGILRGAFEPRVIVEENGLKMSVDLENGQKTGYFLDQKENRLALRRYVRPGGEVLDCFCNSGGFSMNAAAAGAGSVTALDISETALADVRQNAELNGFSAVVRTECGDVFEKLRAYRREGRLFDLVVLDPPAFCKSAAEVRDAVRGYRDINIQGLKLVRPGGFLATSSCSHYMSLPLFQRMLTEAARESGRIVRSVEMRMQAADHPALLGEEESAYLKFVVLHVV